MSKYQPLHQIEKVTELVNELTQIPATSMSDPDEIQQIRSTGQAIAQCLSCLGSRLAELVDLSFECKTETFNSTDDLGQRPPGQPSMVQPYATEDKQERVTCVNASRPEMMAERLPNQSQQQRNEPDSNQTSRSHWRELADFFVSFGFCTDQDGEERLYTRVYHSQLDQSAQWPGIALDQLFNWLLQQAGLSLPARLETQAATALPAQVSSGQSVAQRKTSFHPDPQNTLGLKALLPSARKPETGSPRDEARLNRPGPGSALIQTRLSRPISPLSLCPLTIESPTYPANNLSGQQSIRPTTYLSPNLAVPQPIQLFNHPSPHPSHNFLLILYTLAKLLPPKPKIKGARFG